MSEAADMRPSMPDTPTSDARRARLVALFRLRRPGEAEALADEALARLGRQHGDAAAIDQHASALHDIVRALLREAGDRPSLPPVAAADDDVEFDPATRKALRACFAKLGTESSKLILAYYEFGADGMGDTGAGRIRRRRQLAERLGISTDALRKRALRVRDALETCVRQRMAGDDASIPDLQGS